MYQVPQDTVTVGFSIEEFVTSDSVKIEVTAFAVVPEDSVDIKQKILTALDKAQPGAKWSITGMDRATNDTGQEQVTATATTRIADKDLNGLSKRILAATYPGLRLKHTGTDYAPRQAQIDEAVKKLRKLVYSRANEEVAGINEGIATGEFPWRVGGIQFSMQDDHSNARSPKGGMRAMAMSASLETVSAASGMDDEDSMNLTRKLVMYATVTMVRKVYERL